jgi:hypothetical protein
MAGSRQRARGLFGPAAAVALTAGLLAGCSGTGTEDAASNAALEQAAPAPAGAGAADAAVPRGSGPGAPQVSQTLLQQRAVIQTGSVELVTRHLDRARDAVDRLVARYGGYVSKEQTTSSRSGRAVRSELVLRVPTREFATVVAGLKSLGRVRASSSHSEDVTTEVIDVNSRVETQRASIERLRRLLRSATNVDDMISIEREVATRQASLESLEAQQAYLDDQTSMSTVTVQMSGSPANPQPKRHESGFLAGLDRGWHAMTTFLVGLATVVGAMLPFALALGLVGVPLWLLTRAILRRRPRPVGADAHGASPTGTPE